MQDYISIFKEIIPKGEENAIHKDVLAEMLNTTDVKVKAEIKKARLKGVMICSSQAGYFFPNSRDEVKRFYETMKKQAASRFATLKTFKAFIEEYEGQMMFYEGGEADHGKKE